MTLKRLSNKRILLGISGGIAAYKCAELVRLLKKAGAEVQVIMTSSAAQFVTPMTLQALSGREVRQSLFDARAEAGMSHIELARWADLFLLAPATADSLSRLTQGQADDLLTTVFLATPAVKAVAPAMNQQMWRDRATSDNVQQLKKRGVHIFGPASGEQACGDLGPGRMLEPAALAERAAELFAEQRLGGVRLVVTAGPTVEDIDPVRYLSNRSSGKMGFAIAQAAAEMGANVTLVSGPVALTTPERVQRIDVRSAEQMLGEVSQRLGQMDIFIGCAAVADYRVKQVASQKIKKSEQADPQGLTLELEANPDILHTVATAKERPFCVGFAAETDNLIEYARDKLVRKHLDMIAANLVGEASSGFDAEQNALTVLWAEGEQSLALASKYTLARQLLELVAKHYEKA